MKMKMKNTITLFIGNSQKQKALMAVHKDACQVIGCPPKAVDCDHKVMEKEDRHKRS